MDRKIVYKTLVIGSASVGKTALMQRLIDDVFFESHISTIGVDFLTKDIEVDDTRVKLQIWDTAGQERFQTIVSTYYRCTDTIIICYDITNETSFQQVEHWLNQINAYADDDVDICLIGAKRDLSSSRVISYQKGENLAKKHDLQFFEVSSRTPENVGLILRYLLQNAKKKIDKPAIKTVSLSESVRPDSDKLTEKARCC